jgi:hypothetical protein
LANDTLTKTILGKMHEVLKPRGFRKKGSTFVAEPEDVLQLVQFRKSWTSTSDEVNGFVHVALHSRFLQQKGIGYAAQGEDPRTLEDCHLSTDLGNLTPAQHGVTLAVMSEQEAELVGKEIAHALVEYALPKMASFSSTPKLRAFLEQVSSEELCTWGLLNREYYLQPLREV